MLHCCKTTLLEVLGSTSGTCWSPFKRLDIIIKKAIARSTEWRQVLLVWRLQVQKLTSGTPPLPGTARGRHEKGVFSYSNVVDHRSTANQSAAPEAPRLANPSFQGFLATSSNY